MSSITKAQGTEAAAYVDDLPILTPEQEIVIDCLASGVGNVETFRKAFPNSKANNSSAGILISKMKSEGNVSLWFKRLKEENLIFQSVNYAGHLNELARLRDGARAEKQYSAAVKAEESRGKVGGLYVEQVKDVSLQQTDQAMAAIIEALGETAGRAIAASLGLKVAKTPVIDQD